MINDKGEFTLVGFSKEQEEYIKKLAKQRAITFVDALDKYFQKPSEETKEQLIDAISEISH